MINSPATLASTLAGPGVTVVASSVTTTGSAGSRGLFTNGSVLGISSGVVLGTGEVVAAVGPNLPDSTATNVSYDMGEPGDTDLATLAGATTYDASSLSFDVIPVSSELDFNYVFSSEEYQLYVSGQYNDAFAFFVNGSNIALLPSGQPVTIHTVNSSTNPSYFVLNETYGTALWNACSMNGMTTVLTSKAVVTPGVANHIKLVIADGGDPYMDSNVFIAALLAPTATCTPTITPTSTMTSTGTVSPTTTATPSVTDTLTFTPTRTQTATPSCSATLTPSSSATPSRTATLTCTGTATRTSTATLTPTFTASATPTASDTGTPTPTRTGTATASPSDTATPSTTGTPTCTVTFTQTFSATATATASGTASVTPTLTHTPTLSSSATPTLSATRTASPTATFTCTASPTASCSRTATLSATATPTATQTPTHTPSPTQTQTKTPTFTQTSSPTPSTTPTSTATGTASSTATQTPTLTGSPTLTSTNTVTSTRTDTATCTKSPTLTGTPSTTPTCTVTPTCTISPTITQTDTVTVTPSVTLTPVPEPFSIMVAVYNSAGEKVRLLYQGSAQSEPASISLSAAVLGCGAPVAVYFPGYLDNLSHALIWDGSNDQGQAVANGVYMVAINCRDSDGVLTTLTGQVMVACSSIVQRVAVYNPAGELVDTLPGRNIGQLVDFTLPDGPSFVSPADGQGGEGLRVLLRAANGQQASTYWDGRNSAGGAVSSGVYLLELQDQGLAGGEAVQVERSVMLLRGPARATRSVLVPNPAGAGTDSVTLQYHPLSGCVASAQVFDLSGGRVCQVQSQSSSTGRLSIPVRGLSAGVYLVRFTQVDGGTVQASSMLKLAIVH